MDDKLDFPTDVEIRLYKILIENYNERVDFITELVSLQETELIMLWVAIVALGFFTYYRTKD